MRSKMPGALTEGACAASCPRRQGGVAWFTDSLDRLGGLVLPPRCPGCGTPVAADHRFCADCWGSLRFIAPPWCAGCNRPFAHDRGEGVRCGPCLARPPQHAGVRAAVAYGEVPRRLALKLKYGRRIGVAATMAGQIARLVPADLELLMPVPLNRWRLWSRGYNQAALIATELGRRCGLAVDPVALTRVRRTVVLRGLDPHERARAVAGAFRVAERSRVAGRRIGLVDDVHTSGATAEACTRVLLAAGARSVVVLCWARVLGDDVGD